jgi:uncharacterized protein (TIGR03083 family)
MTTQAQRPDRTGWLPWDEYLAVLALDAARLSEVGGMGLDRPVPSCPGWTVADVVRHTATVYLHKVECMRAGRAPDDWPPEELARREPIELYDAATATLLEELTSRHPDEARGTWWPEDQTVGFWYRRMAQETAVHRVDVELGHGVVTPVDEALAVDGIDEVLRIMLGGPWWDGDEFRTAERVDDRVRVTAAGRSWTVTLGERAVKVSESDAGDVAVEVAGQPEDVYLWLWGRRRPEPLAVTGSDEVAAAFRRRLQEAL